jgi:hypothetical protein
MILAAATLLGASLIHSGLAVPLGGALLRDPFAGAAIPEAVLAAVLSIGVIGWLAGWRRRRAVALGSVLFSLLVTFYGLSITLLSGRTGDIVYHLTLISLLVAATGLLLRRAPRSGGVAG